VEQPHLKMFVKDRLCEPEGGGSEWEPIKILLEGDENSNKTKTTSKTHLRLNYPSWSRSRNHWSATGPRNQQPPSKTHLRLNYPSWSRTRNHWNATGPRNQQPPKLTRERSGRTNSSSYWATPVRPVPAGAP
jgi:hypothetical protein